MAIWPTEPVWTDPTTLNRGNKYDASNGVTSSDMNAIIQNLQYLKASGGTSGGAFINGEVKQYKVRPGKTVNAGDFVEFIQHWSKDPLNNEVPTVLRTVNLTDNTIAVFYNATDAIRCVVAELGEDAVTIKFDNNIVIVPNGEFTTLDVDVINSTDFVIGYSYTAVDDETETTKYGTFISVGRFADFYTSVTMGNTWGYDNAYAYQVRVVNLFDGYVAVAWITTYSPPDSGAAYPMVYTYDSETLNFYAPGFTQPTGFNVTGNSLALIKLDATHLAFIYELGGLRISILTLSTSGLVYSTYDQYLMSNTDDSVTVIKKDDTNYYIVNRYLTLIQYSDGEYTTTSLSTSFLPVAPLSASFVDNRIIVLYKKDGLTYIRSCSLDDLSSYVDLKITSIMDGNILSASNSDNSFINVSSISDLATGGLTDPGIYVQSFNVTDDGTLIENTDNKGTFVQPATSRLYNVGVAKTGNAGGGVVDVYVVPLFT